MKIRLVRVFAALLIATQLTGCGSDNDEPPTGQDPRNPPALTAPLVNLTPFSSQAEFDAFVLTARNTASAGGFVERGDNFGPALPPGAPAADGTIPTSGGTPLSPDHSTTNIQEPGVDEPDSVKTDGTYVYVAGDQKVSIVSTAAQPLAVAGEIKVPGYASSLLLTDDKKLVVLYSPNGAAYETRLGDLRYFYYALTGIMIVDVNDPASPVVLRSAVIEAYMHSVRRVGNMLYLVLGSQAFPAPLGVDAPSAPVGSDGDKPVVSDSSNTATPTLPQIIELNADGSVKSSGPAIAVTDIFHPDLPRGSDMVLITGFNLADLAAPLRSKGYLGYASTVYASSEALYIADPQWIGAIVVGTPGIGVAEPVSGGSGGSMPPVAVSPPSSVVRAVTDGPHTVIHKFALAQTDVTLAASGHISGVLLNQYALSDSGNFLRAASSTGWNLGAEVSVLEQRGTELVVVGSLPNIGADENLVAARFMGDRGYLVTFLQTDPLFTVDLSDPRAPKLVGELVVPGFSDYLHPVSDSFLLGLGRDAGRTGGVQLSVFDVTNFAQPTLHDKAVIGTSATDSEATANPKAFNYWPARQLITFPVREFNSIFAPNFEPRFYEGLYVFKLLPDLKLEFMGSMGKNVDYYPNWRRAVFIGDQLYSVNEFEVAVASISSVDEITSTLELAPANPTPPPVVFPAQ